MEYDVVVVGAGPAGSMAAKYAAKAGARVLMIEEHETIGLPVQCAGLISTRAFEGCELETLNKHAIRGAHIHAPSGRVLRVDGKRTMAYVVDRSELDRAMALEALKSGVASLVKTRFSGLRREGTKLVVTAISHGEPIEIQTSVLIGADGLQSTVGRLAGLDRVQSVLTCAQAEVYTDIVNPDFVELYVGQDVAPSFFAWAIPTQWGTVRIGLCSSERSMELLNSLIGRISPRSAASLVRFSAGAIPIGPPACTVTDGILIVGDAAGQAVTQGDTSKSALKEYDRQWRSEVGRELVTGLRIRDGLNKLSDDELDYVIEALDDEKILDIISRYGDMDHPSIVLRKLLFSTKAPRLLKLIKPMIKLGIAQTNQ
jgi:digeranylgeranylglycerophospholipid reductase